ncbi:hypothetical protein KCU94_g206, partial [Aureobasidium melanogenum]
MCFRTWVMPGARMTQATTSTTGRRLSWSSTTTKTIPIPHFPSRKQSGMAQSCAQLDQQESENFFGGFKDDKAELIEMAGMEISKKACKGVDEGIKMYDKAPSKLNTTTTLQASRHTRTTSMTKVVQEFNVKRQKSGSSCFHSLDARRNRSRAYLALRLANASGLAKGVHAAASHWHGDASLWSLLHMRWNLHLLLLLLLGHHWGGHAVLRKWLQRGLRCVEEPAAEAVVDRGSAGVAAAEVAADIGIVVVAAAVRRRSPVEPWVLWGS